MPLPVVHPTAGMVIDHSVRIKPGVYALTSSSLRSPAIRVRGDNITLDPKGVVLRGSPIDTAPDQRHGLAILVDGGANVTIENAAIHGYKLAILAKKTTGLKLTRCDWSYNWKQHLKSTPEREDESDWMFFHHNEHDEWINGNPDTGVAYGCGGVYLTGCKGFQVDHCVDTGSQCGLMMSRSSTGVVIDNDFSFLSAVGIGLYRSRDNVIKRNSLDYCVRGYSHYVYSRGQDSASILVYEQSNRNIFSNNSATRGGDGFFLWAGQSTMDTGQGGCNDNIVTDNDFSHSPANGIEATFSRNDFERNRLVECWHGVWGGFSYSSKWSRNCFQFDGQAFAIEQGQDNSILFNSVVDCDEGAVIWAIPDRARDSGYLKNRDIRSRDNRIDGNLFWNCVKEAVSIADSTGTHLADNAIRSCGADVLIREGKMVVSGPARTEPKRPTSFLGDGNNNPIAGPLNGRFASWGLGPFPTAHPATSPAYAHLRGPNEWGREHILVDEWGPYDYRSPMLWPTPDLVDRRLRPCGSSARAVAGTWSRSQELKLWVRRKALCQDS